MFSANNNTTVAAPTTQRTIPPRTPVLQATKPQEEQQQPVDLEIPCLDVKPIFLKHSNNKETIDKNGLAQLLTELYGESSESLEAFWALTSPVDGEISFEQFSSQYRTAKGKHGSRQQKFDLDVQFNHDNNLKKDRTTSEMKDDQDVSLDQQ